MTELYRRKQQEIDDARNDAQDAKITNTVITKILSSNVTTNGEIVEFTTPLTIGKWYEVSMQIRFEIQTPSENGPNVTINHDGIAKARLRSQVRQDAATLDENDQIDFTSVKFLATANSVTFTVLEANGDSQLIGNGGMNNSFIQIEERNDLE